ncbi:MAG: hypothetical protein HDR43_01730 [Mycoplasma sp.]|nr:hypothetical protein [Mycoplasma sp.]
MSYLINKYLSWKIFLIVFVLIFLSFIFLLILFNVEIKKINNAILEVDQNKNFSLKFSTSNINLLTTQKDLSITLESKTFFLEDVEFINQGNNIYRINFYNDELYKLVKTNSLYEVRIFSSSKKIFEIIFNI